MAKIKRINLIARGKKVIAELFDKKVRRINRALDSALDTAEENVVTAKEDLLEKINLLGKAETDKERQEALNSILEKMDEIEQWKTRCTQVKEIQRILEEEVEEETEE